MLQTCLYIAERAFFDCSLSPDPAPRRVYLSAAQSWSRSAQRRTHNWAGDSLVSKLENYPILCVMLNKQSRCISTRRNSWSHKFRSTPGIIIRRVPSLCSSPRRSWGRIKRYMLSEYGRNGGVAEWIPTVCHDLTASNDGDLWLVWW